MRTSCMSINHVGVQQAVKDVARFMKESNERAWIMLKCLVRYFMDHGRFVQVVQSNGAPTAIAYVLTSSSQGQKFLDFA